MALDVQVIAGLLLYFGLSPFTKQGLNHLDLALTDPGLRFWTFVHLGVMLSANVLVRIGRVLAINATTPAWRRRWRVVFFALTTLTIIVGIPWPGMANGRPLFRY
jgi:hypothetical protein